jgi:hypothetical protein
MKPKYYTVDEMLEMVDEPNRLACQRLLADNRHLFWTARGSTYNHQAWAGGYIDHVQEIMNLAVQLYAQLNAIRPLPFSLSDILIVTYLHDVEKPWKYELGEDGVLRHKASLSTKDEHQKFRAAKLAEYGIELTPDLENGIQFAEGEIGSYTNKRRVMGPLAALAHMCDVASARPWFDHPMAEDDPWMGAGRIRE